MITRSDIGRSFYLLNDLTTIYTITDVDPNSWMGIEVIFRDRDGARFITEHYADSVDSEEGFRWCTWMDNEDKIPEKASGPSKENKHSGHKIITNQVAGKTFTMCKNCCEEIF